MAEAVTTGIDESRNTGDEPLGRSRNVVKPHIWPMFMKTVKISVGQGETIQNGAIGLGHQCEGLGCEP